MSDPYRTPVDVPDLPAPEQRVPEKLPMFNAHDAAMSFQHMLRAATGDNDLVVAHHESRESFYVGRKPFPPNELYRLDNAALEANATKEIERVLAKIAAAARKYETTMANEAMERAIELARRYYARGAPGEYSGGNLHIALDDGNLEDDDVAFCRDYAVRADDAMGVEVADALAALSIEERQQVYARYLEYRTP